MNKNLPITICQHTLSAFCQQYYIKKLSLFGSVLRDDFTDKSDVDFLVEFEAGKAPSFFTLARMERELSAIINWHKVDLRTPSELSIYFRDRVMQEAKVLYELS